MTPATTPEQQTAEFEAKIALLSRQLEALQKQAELDREMQAHDATTARATLDALKAQSEAQVALDKAQAGLPFAPLQGIQGATSGLTLPKGKEGTLTVAAGTAGAALLRSKGPMLHLLDDVASTLLEVCGNSDAVLLTENQLQQAYRARFVLDAIEDQKTTLAEARAAVGSGRAAGASALEALALAPIMAGAYTVGMVLNTVNSFAKLLRSNRALDLFGYDSEAAQLLGYLLESRRSGFSANPGLLGDEMKKEADALLGKLKELRKEVVLARDLLARIERLAALPANAPERAGAPQPDDDKVVALKTEVEAATATLDSLQPASKPDEFWAQVGGQVIAKRIEKKHRLLVEVKAQAVQVTESHWYSGDHLRALGEVQVAYRLLDESGAPLKAGIILRASPGEGTPIDTSESLDLEWPERG